jgi:hypothetical protein
MDDVLMHERVSVNVSFDRERGYVATHPELGSITALPLAGLCKRIEALSGKDSQPPTRQARPGASATPAWHGDQPARATRRRGRRGVCQLSPTPDMPPPLAWAAMCQQENSCNATNASSTSRAMISMRR